MTAETEARWVGLARFGPFFAVDLADPSQDWRPIDELGRADVLRRRADAVAAALGAGLPPGQTVPCRVAASVSQLGLCARLSAVALAAATDGLTIPDPEHWRYVDRLGGPFPVTVSATADSSSDLARGSWSDVLLALVGPVARATVATFALSPQVVWGNVASGLTGAARMIAAADPGAAAAVDERLTAALSRPELTSTVVADGSGAYRRRSCCLIYRLSGSRAGICGDCVLQRS